MPDEKAPMPPQPKTQEIPALTDRALLEDLSRVVRDGFARTDRRFDALETAVDIQGNMVKDVAGRMSMAEQRLQRMEEERRNDSMPVKLGRVSENDSKQDAAIAKIIGDVDGVKKDVAGVKADVSVVKDDVAGVKSEVGDVKTAVLDIKKAVTGFFENKKVKMVGKVLFGVAMAYAAAKGIHVLP